MQKSSIIILLAMIMVYFQGFSNGNEPSSLSVGAAKVSFTPDLKDLPKFQVGEKLSGGVKNRNFTNVRDSLFSRAIVIDNGITRSALIAIDAGRVTDEFYTYISNKIESETGIPFGNIFIIPSHTHSSLSFANRDLNTNSFFKETDSKIIAHTIRGENSIIEAVKSAIENIQPAQIGYETGISYCNVNRDVINPETRLWSQGPNYDGVSDKTVAVVSFVTLTGEPIAFFYNYAMHANYMMSSGSVSAGIPGETSKYIEKYFDDKVIALWSMGAAGDQNPRYMKPMADVINFKTQYALSSGLAKDHQEAITLSSQVDIAVDPKLLERQSQMCSSMGQILGEEILRVIALTKRFKTNIDIYSDQEIISCPGRIRTNSGRQGAPGTYVDGEPVDIRLSLLIIGDIAFTGVNAEVYNLIAQRLKKESPLSNTIFVSITNGRAISGYVVSDDAYQRNTFQVLGSRLQPGFAEDGIVNGFVDLIEKVK